MSDMVESPRVIVGSWQKAVGSNGVQPTAYSLPLTDFDELYKQYAPMVHGIVLARVPYDEAGDIVQEVFLSAFKNLHTLRDPNAVGGWLASIARNKANKFYRQKRPTEELPEGLTGKRDLKQEAAEALTAIRSLPDTYR